MYTYPKTLTAPETMPMSRAVQGRMDTSAETPMATPPARVATMVSDESGGSVVAVVGCACRVMLCVPWYRLQKKMVLLVTVNQNQALC